MNVSKKIIASLALATAVASSAAVYAQTPDTNNSSVDRPQIERPEITADQWTKIREVLDSLRTAIDAQDYDQAQEITRSMFQNLHPNRGEGMKGDHHGPSEEVREAIHTAIENNDYAAWKEAVSSDENQPGIVDKVTEENFAKFVEMHTAREAGDHEKAKEIADELGLKPPRGGEHGPRFGGEQGDDQGQGVGQGGSEEGQGHHGPGRRGGRRGGERGGELQVPGSGLGGQPQGEQS